MGVSLGKGFTELLRPPFWKPSALCDFTKQCFGQVSLQAVLWVVREGEGGGRWEG
jgi:hypothetical protein